PVLQRHVGEIVVVIVYRALVIEIADTEERLRFLAYMEFGRDVGTDFTPAGAESIDRQGGGGTWVFGDDVDESTDRFASVERRCGAFHDFHPLDERLWDATKTVDGR